MSMPTVETGLAYVKWEALSFEQEASESQYNRKNCKTRVLQFQNLTFKNLNLKKNKNKIKWG